LGKCKLEEMAGAVNSKAKHIGHVVFRLAVVFAVLNSIFWSVSIGFDDRVNLLEIKIICWIATSVAVTILIILFGLLGRKVLNNFSEGKKWKDNVVYVAALFGILMSVIGFWVYADELLNGLFINANDPPFGTVDPIRVLELKSLVFNFEDVSAFGVLLLPTIILPLITLAILWAISPKKGKN